MNYPRIYIALDNCFALKRWIEPKTWGRVIAEEIGFTSVQASFDNEIDMLYGPADYRTDWFRALTEAEKKYGFKVESFYTGYQTYRTSGLSHPDERYVRQLMDGWIKPAIDRMAEKQIDMGFALHGIPENILQDPEKFYRHEQYLYEKYDEIAAYAQEKGVRVCVEAMYSPHHTPWTIEGTKEFLRNVYQRGKHPIYTTVDVGHMTGQKHFRKPDKEQIKNALERAVLTGNLEGIWLGGESVYLLAEKAIKEKNTGNQTLAEIMREMDRYPYQFSTDKKDDDLYAWVKELACYSPIMHIQQTDGIKAAHFPFTEENNKKGIVDGKKLLLAIRDSYERKEENMPPKTDKIVLGLELFVSNTDHPRDIVKNMRETKEYWRQFIPQDGLPLDALLERL